MKQNAYKYMSKAKHEDRDKKEICLKINRKRNRCETLKRKQNQYK